MPDFKDHADVLVTLTARQDADSDIRQESREAHIFIDKKDGQWEPFWWEANKDAPRYTFDLISPVVDQIAGEIEQADFDIQIRPSGGEASKENAKLLDGLIRNIETMSNASDIFNDAGRNMVTGGLDGWEVKQKRVDDDSFDQDLVIEPVANWLDSVWFGPHTRKDASDSKYGFKLEAFTRQDYDERWPKGSGQSVGSDRTTNAYWKRDDIVIVGQLYHITLVPRVLVKTSRGRVFTEKEVAPVEDELAAQGETVIDRRTVNKKVVKSHLFDGGDWLNKEQETAFNFVPLIPTYGNFKILESVLLYRGVVAKLMDSGRVFNYAKSREIGEGALGPRSKYWLTAKQTAGHSDTLATLNTNTDPVQEFNPDPENPGTPQLSPGPQVNQGLRTIGEDMRTVVGQTAGLFAANMGDNPGLQSGVAIEKLQDKGNTGTIKYFSAQEAAICHTARILIDAIPRVYSEERQVRILREDGSFDMTTVNQKVLDQQTLKQVTLNDLSRGKYDVTCSSGPSFQNRQQETVSAILELAQVDPDIIQTGGDVLLNNIDAPGVDLIADRKREQLLNAGIIPEEQMTDEEKARLQQAQEKAQEPDPAMLLGQAELIKAQTGQAEEQRKGTESQIDVRERELKLELAQNKEGREDAKFDHAVEQDAFSQFLQINQQQMAEQKQLFEQLKSQAETLKVIREAMGVDSIVGPGNTEAYVEQAQQVQGAQELTETP